MLMIIMMVIIKLMTIPLFCFDYDNDDGANNNDNNYDNGDGNYISNDDDFFVDVDDND